VARGEAGIEFKRLPQEGAGFFQDEGGDIARGRGLAEAGVERELGGGEDGLIWREGSHGKKARRVAGQSGKGDHADPRGDSVRWLVEECGAEEADFPKGIRVEKGEKFRGRVEGAIPIETLEPIDDFIDGWWIESRGGKHFAKRVGIGSGGDASPQGGLERRGAAPHERIKNDLARLGKLLDEIGGERGLEAGAVGNFVKGVAAALSGAPENSGFHRRATFHDVGNRRFRITQSRSAIFRPISSAMQAIPRKNHRKIASLDLEGRPPVRPIPVRPKSSL